MKLTGWYSGDQKPARVGVYERDYKPVLGMHDVNYAYWNGETWGMGAYDRETAKWYHRAYSQRGSAGLPWRGIAK